MLRESEPLVVEVIEAVRRGDGASVRRLLDASPGLAGEYIEAAGSARTLLHVVTGCPNGPAIARMLIEAGADPNARTTGGGESPLHVAASNDDADVAEALIDGGADLEIPDGSIGTPLDNAIEYGCWNVARLLVNRGATVDKLWHAAALGKYDSLLDLLSSEEALTEAFFQACDGGQRRAAELLLTRGVHANAAPAALGTQRDQLVEWLREHGARPRSANLTGGSAPQKSQR
jgi:uncharacterized protein